MNAYETAPSDCCKGLTPIQSAARAFAWGEVFVLIPMHAFWMLFRCTPFIAENTASATVAALPIVLLIVAGLLALIPRVRAAIVSAEWICHLTAALGMLALLLYVTLRDPFSPALPITWPLCFWSVCMAFAALSSLVLHERVNSQAGPGGRTSWLLGIATAVAAWAVLVWLGSGMAWAPYLWTASLAFHAVMVPCSRRRSGEVMPSAANWHGSIVALVENVFLVSLMLAAVLRMVFTCTMVGRVEMKYLEFVNQAVHPAFIIGVAGALVAGRFRVSFVTHIIAAGLFFFTSDTTTWPITLVLGYGLAALFMSTGRQGALGFALTLPVVAVVWALGMLGFMTAGVIIVFDMGQAFARGLAGNMRVFAPSLLAIWLVATGLNFWWTKRNSRPSAGEPRAVPRVAPILAYSGAWLVAVVFVAYFVATTMWPPVSFEEPRRRWVGEPAGVCHAGYSRSDEEYEDLHRLGVRIMRIDFHWENIQKDADTWDFSRYDDYVEAAQKHNVKVLALLVFDNNAVEKNEKGASLGHYMAPEDVPQYLEYIRRTVARYKGRVYAWELWNEPDIPRFWNGPIEELYELIRVSAKTVKEVDPDAILLGPAMTSPLGVDAAEGMERLHVIGALEPVDHPTMHTYISDPRVYYNEYYRVMNIAAKHGHQGSVWVTELGDPDGGVYPWRGSRDHLAVHAMKSYTIASRVGIGGLIWYCYRDSDIKSLIEKPDNSEGFFGLTEREGEWKPAAYAYSLFSKNCSNSEICLDLLDVSGGLAGRQLRAVLYRRENLDSTLVMWFEPGLRPGAHARVTVDLGLLGDEPAVCHGITNGDTKPLLDKVIDVTETPTFITFKAEFDNAPVRLRAVTSPADTVWLLLAAGLIVASVFAAFRPRVVCASNTD